MSTKTLEGESTHHVTLQSYGFFTQLFDSETITIDESVRTIEAVPFGNPPLWLSRQCIFNVTFWSKLYPTTTPDHRNIGYLVFLCAK